MTVPGFERHRQTSLRRSEQRTGTMRVADKASDNPWWRDGASGGTMRAHRCGKTPDTMRSVEMRKRRSEPLPKTCRRAEDALPYSTLECPSGNDVPATCRQFASRSLLALAFHGGSGAERRA